MQHLFCALYSTAERVALIEKHWDTKLCSKTLQTFYKENNVKYIGNKRVYKSSLTKFTELEERRCEFAVQLADQIKSGRRVIYLDESSINNWVTKARSWAP